jgi:hypothetical protein
MNTKLPFSEGSLQNTYTGGEFLNRHFFSNSVLRSMEADLRALAEVELQIHTVAAFNFSVQFSPDIFFFDVFTLVELLFTAGQAQ